MSEPENPAAESMRHPAPTGPRKAGAFGQICVRPSASTRATTVSGHDRRGQLSDEQTITHVLLDVDGVLNALTYEGAPDPGWECPWKGFVHRFGYYEGAPAGEASPLGYPIHYKPDLIAALNRLAARPSVKFFWLTTWLDEAPYGLAPRLGLHGRAWPVLGKTEWKNEGSTHGWWKLRAARAHAAAHSHARIIWCDDDLRLNSAATTWLAEFGADGLPIIPRYDTGLTPEHIAQMQTFVEKCDARP